MNNLLPDANNTRSECGCERPRRVFNMFCRCSSKVLAFLAFLLAGTIGLIVGAYFSAALITAIAAVILGAVLLAVMIAITLIYRSCAGCERHERCDE